MRETWVRPNRRALALGLIVPLLLVLSGLLALLISDLLLLQMAGALLACGGAAVTGLLAFHLTRPRVALRDDNVHFFLRTGRPLTVPLDVVEAFFLGRGPAHLPPGVHGRAETVNLVARLSQRETTWQSRPVKPALGSWQEGYITIRGAWCEPLHLDLVNRLNKRLAELKRDRKQVADEVGL